MRRLAALFPLFFAVVLLLTLPHTAEAKRMGGGSTLGKQYSVPQRDSAGSATAARPVGATSAAAAPRQGGASRWLGPLAGLAAGGLLAAMLFGDGFEGFQLLDFLVIAGLVFGAIMLFRAMRPRPMPQPAGGPAFGGGFPAGEAATVHASQGVGGGNMGAPAWFNAESFLNGARVHFIRLQAAWDQGDMKDIASYTTPELYAELQAQRLASGNATHYTEVSYIDAELLGVQRDGDSVVATVRFFGGIKEEQDGETQQFAELWHVVHGWESAAGDWYVAGIQQVAEAA